MKVIHVIFSFKAESKTAPNQQPQPLMNNSANSSSNFSQMPPGNFNIPPPGSNGGATPLMFLNTPQSHNQNSKLIFNKA